jgi:hypothetical protein
MKKKRFLMGILVITLVSGIVLTGCATSKVAPLSYYSEKFEPNNIRGEESNSVLFGLIGAETFPPVDRVAKNNGITRIATVEHFVKPSFLYIYTTYTTVVTGE